MFKKILLSLGTVGLASVLIATVSADGASSAAPSTATTIALVNEDEPASFNGTEYLFGKEFVSLTANDSRYDWQVVSRSVAEKAYADDGVTAVIVLPRSFSHDLLTLEDLNPVKAAIEYKVSGDDALTRQRLENRLSTILKDFNSRIVQMYFASIAGNIAGAQVNVSDVVARQSALVDSLSSTAYPGIQTIEKGNGESAGLAAILQSMNSAWISAQNRFTEGTTKTLTSIGDSLNAQQPNLSKYFAQQEQIARTNVANGNTAISEQGASDKDFYDDEFSAHVDRLRAGDGTWSGLAGFSSTAPDGTRTGALTTLTDAVARYDGLARMYNDRVTAAVGSLTDQRDRLNASANALDDLEKQLLHEYFLVDPPADGSPVDISSLTAEQARKALAQRLANTFSASGQAATAVSTYEKRIQDLVRTIPTDAGEYNALFSALQANPRFDPAPYLSRLALIKKYGDAHGITAPSLTVLNPSPTARSQRVSRSIPVAVAAGETKTVSIDLPPTLTAADVKVRSSDAATECGAVGPACISIDEASDLVTIDNTGGAVELTVVLEYAIDAKNLDGITKISYSSQSVTPEAQPAPESLGSDVYVLAPNAGATATVSEEDFAAVTGYLGDIRATADLLGFLYGAPGEDTDAFASAVLADGRFDDHSSESVFTKYGSIDALVIEERLDPADVASYRDLGLAHIKAVVDQVDALHEVQSALGKDIDTLSGMQPLSPTLFSDAVRHLESWYTAALAAVNAAPAAWESRSNTTIQLETLPWNGQEPGKHELYLDDRTGPALYASLSQLVGTTSQSATSVAASAQIIADNTSQFDTLVSGVRKTQADTQAVLDAMKNTITTGSSDAAAGGEFSKQFASVLANTRASGADPATIYETFASPIATKDRTPAPPPTTSAGFDYRWALIFVAGSLIGALIAYLVLRRGVRARKEA